MGFKKAVRESVKLRAAICGATGSGKTMTALTIAKALGDRVALIDTERSSASLYANKFDFDTMALHDFRPEAFMSAVKEADSAGYDVLVIDSLSHAWEGILNELDRIGGNSFTAWKKMTPRHRDFINCILDCSMHVIVTMRSKMEYVLEENSRGKQEPRKVGMSPVQRAGLEYEFDIIMDMDEEHQLKVSKSRFDEVADAVVNRPTSEFGNMLKACIADGAAPEPKASPASCLEAVQLLADLDFEVDQMPGAIGRALKLGSATSPKRLTASQMTQLLTFLHAKVAAKAGEVRDMPADHFVNADQQAQIKRALNRLRIPPAEWGAVVHAMICEEELMGRNNDNVGEPISLEEVTDAACGPLVAFMMRQTPRAPVEAAGGAE